MLSTGPYGYGSLRVTLFSPQLIISWLRHRRESIDGDFAIDSSRSIDTALAPPPSCPLFQGSPSANALAARELLVTSPTYRYARTHARTHRTLVHAHAHAHLYACTRNTHADRARVLYSERKVRPRGRMRAWGTSVSTSIKPRFRGLGLIFCLVLFILFLRRRLPPPPPPPIGAFSTSSHVLEYEMRAAIFPPLRRRST